MSLCFVCDTKLEGEQTQMSTGITPYSHVPYIEKIAELLGDEFVIIVNSTDHMCMECTSLLTNLDKLENDLKLVKNAIFSYIQKKYDLLPPDQVAKSVKPPEMLNKHLIADKHLKPGQYKVPSGQVVKETPTFAFQQVRPPIKLLKIQPQQLKKPQQLQNHQKIKKQQQCVTNKNKILKYDTQVIRFKTFIDSNKKEPEKPIINPTAAAKISTLVPQPKKLCYRCQICSKSFVSRFICLEHIQKEHRKPTAMTSNREIKKKYSCPATTNIFKFNLTTQNNDQEMESLMDTDNNQQDNIKITVGTEMMLNDSVFTKKCADTEQEEETNNTEERVETNFQANIVKEFKSIKKSEPFKLNLTSQNNNQKVESPTAIDNNHQDDIKITVGMDMMLNDSAPVEKSEDIEQEEKTNNTGEGVETEFQAKTVKESKSIKKPETAKEEEQEKYIEDAAKPEPEKEAIQAETLNSVEKVVDKDTVHLENNKGDLDIESMLAAIHNENPPTKS